MVVAIIITIIVVLVAYGFGFAAGQYAEKEEYGETRKVFERGLWKIDKYENWKAHMKSVTNSDDIDALFIMGLRLISCGVDPKDIITIDRIGMAVAEGKFEPKREEKS